MQPVDLYACDTEPIHLIGHVQPQGALLAAREGDLEVVYASRNIGDYLPVSLEEVFSRPLAQVLGESTWAMISAFPLEPGTPHAYNPVFIKVTNALQETPLECLAHRHRGFVILEFMRPDPAPIGLYYEEELRRRIISKLSRADRIEELARISASLIREVTGFDRVMVYRFAEDQHGQVIAEATGRPDSFFGMHYPASDIPDPARRHFLLNVIRTIPDIDARPIAIVSEQGVAVDAESGMPLDLTHAKLRAVAPVHVQYLRNMGVAASLSISLVSNAGLWGLIACHHYSPHQVPSSRLRLCELLGVMISTLLQSIENRTKLRQSVLAERVAFSLEQAARRYNGLGGAVERCSLMVRNLIGASGLVLRVGERTMVRGNVPVPLFNCDELIQRCTNGVFVTDHLSDDIALDPEQWKAAAGAALLELSEDRADFMLLTRDHFEETIRWAGKPEKLEQRLADGTIRLSPRGSFALWREERVGRSRPFTPQDKEALRILRRALFALNSLEREREAVRAQKEAQAHEARLRLELLDAAREGALGELASALAHELTQPLAAVTNYVNACRQMLRASGHAVPDLLDDLISETVSEAARAAELVRRLRDFIASGELVCDYIDLDVAIRQGLGAGLNSGKGPPPTLELAFDANLPRVLADPVQIGQVVLNLVHNSITAMEDSPQRKLVIAAWAARDQVCVSVSDTGCGVDPEIRDVLFEPFQSRSKFGMGIGLSLCRTIIEAHSGRIWLEPTQSGAKFVFSLPIMEAGDGTSR